MAGDGRRAIRQSGAAAGCLHRRDETLRRRLDEAQAVVLEHSPAEFVRRPNVPPESPTLGLTHLQLEALLTAGRDSTNANEFALVCLLGLLGLRIFEATGADVTDLGEEHGHRVLRVRG